MTISTTALTKSYSGNGVTVAFSFPYRFLANGDLVVTLIAADDTETLQVITTDYTVTGAGDDAGGTVTMVTAPASGETLFIRRTVALTQEVDYITGESFPAETHEQALDRLTMIAQQLTEANERSLRLSDTDISGASTELPIPEANKPIGWNAAGDALTNLSVIGEYRGNWTISTVYNARDIFRASNGYYYYVDTTHTSTTEADSITKSTIFLDFVLSSAVFDSVQFSGGTGSQGTVSWNDEDETLDLIQNGAVLQMGQEVQWHVRNTSGSTITNGTPVMATGTVGASSRITVSPMDGTVASNAHLFMGIATYDIANGDDGKVTHFGKVRGINTSSWSEGEMLYISTATPGVLTNVEPTSGMVLPVAFVVYSNASNGVIAVRVTNTNEQSLVRTDEAQTFTASQRGTITTDNDLSFDLSVTNNFVSTPTGSATLTFTNHTSGQSGHILLTNSSNYTFSAAATTKISATDLSTISTTGVYLLSYLDNGTNTYVVVSGDLT